MRSFETELLNACDTDWRLWTNYDLYARELVGTSVWKNDFHCSLYFRIGDEWKIFRMRIWQAMWSVEHSLYPLWYRRYSRLEWWFNRVSCKLGILPRWLPRSNCGILCKTANQKVTHIIRKIKWISKKKNLVPYKRSSTQQNNYKIYHFFQKRRSTNAAALESYIKTRHRSLKISTFTLISSSPQTSLTAAHPAQRVLINTHLVDASSGGT